MFLVDHFEFQLYLYKIKRIFFVLYLNILTYISGYSTRIPYDRKKQLIIFEENKQMKIITIGVQTL